MQQNPCSVQQFDGKRVRCESPRSFDEVLQNLKEQVGTTARMDVLQGLSESTRKHYEEVVRSELGESGFMPFLWINHGEWLSLYGIQRKVIRLIFGNPLIAITMNRHDITAGLFTPVELLLFENESGSGSTIVYYLPSSLIGIEQHPPLLAAAKELDRKVQDLVSRVTGVAADRVFS